MTDKELLTLAAKAAGIEVTHYVFGKGLSLANPKEGMQILPRVWNPLNSDADALRLAVKLGLDIEIDSIIGSDPWTRVVGIKHEWTHKTESFFTSQSHKDDPYAATRRAIVRAAAEIGRSMG